MSFAIISHPECRLHDPGEHHPDRPERLDAIQDRLISSGLQFVTRFYDAPLVDREDLILAHDAGYVDRVFRLASSQGSVDIDGDTVMTPHTINAARRAAGAVVLGVDLIMRTEASAVFCAVRPPGHHAERKKAMGFCLFNNVAVGASHAIAKYDLDRVAILDFDVHHGNGTEDIFRSDHRVLFCSSFQHPFYPYTGHESDTKQLVAVPLADGTDGTVFREKIEEHWMPALEAFRPQLILISAGFDAHALDDMSGLALREADFAWVTAQIMSVANAHASGRVVSVLEGGYHLGALGRSVAAHLKALLD